MDKQGNTQKDNKLSKPGQLFATTRDHAQQMLLTYSTFGLLESARKLLAENRQETLINTQNYLGYTPLMLAIMSQNVEFLRFVLGYESVNMNLKTFIQQKKLH